MKLSYYDTLTISCLLEYTLTDPENAFDMADKYTTSSLILSTMTPHEININIDTANRYVDSLSTEQLVEFEEKLDNIDTDKLVNNTISKTYKKV